MRWSLFARTTKSQPKNQQAGRRRPRLDRWRTPLYLESLEDRTLLSVIHWTATTSGDWNTAANWDGGVPQATDDVVINVAGVTVTHASGNHSVKSIQSTDALVISGGSLTVTAGASQVSGALTVGRATLTASGTGTTFTATAATTINGASLSATGGATLALPMATSYAGADYGTAFQAGGAGSKLDLSHLTTLKGGGPFSSLSVQASAGGLIDLSGATSNPGGAINVVADGTNSVVDLSQLPKIASDVYNNSSLEARNSGTIRDPLLTTLNRVDVTVNATGILATRQITALTGATITVNGTTPDFSGLTSIDGLSLYVNAGGTLALNATGYAGAGYNTTLQASGAGSKLDLSHLTTLKGGGPYSGLSVNALAGGLVDLSGVTTNPGGQVVVLADGTNSIVDLSQLPKMISDAYNNSALQARNSGTIRDPLLTTLNRVDVAVNPTGTLATRQITTLTGATITVNGTTPDFSGLTAIDGLSLYVNGGGTLALALTGYAGAGYNTTLQASGAGSKLDLSHLTTLKGGGPYSGLSVNALAGGLVDLSGVTTNPGGQVAILADGTNSVVDLSRLPRMTSDAYNNSALQARNSGTIRDPLLTTLNRVDVTVNATGTLATRQITALTGATITVNGTTPDFSGLTSIDGLSLYVNAGGTLALNATGYAGAGYNTTLQASGAGSKLDLSHLTTLKGGGTYSGLSVNALAGGLVDLSGVTTNPGGQVAILADGTNSVVDLSQLPKMISDAYFDSALEARNSGTIKVPLLTTLNRTDITVRSSGTLNTHQITTFTAGTLTDNGTTPDFTNLASADGSSFVVNSGGTLALPALTGYTGGNNFNSTFQASDANSKLDLSHLTTLKGASTYSSLSIQARAAGRVDLSGVTNNSGGTINVVADGTGSTVDLSRLPRFASDAYWFSSLEAHPGATILTPRLTAISRVDLKITGTGSVDTSVLTNADGSGLWVSGGGTLALPALTSYTAGTGFNSTFQASGAGSKLDLSHLTTLKGASSYAFLNVQAQAGGRIDLSGVTSNPGGTVSVLADGVNSVVDLSRLPRLASDAPFNSGLTAHNSGTVQLTTGTITLGRTDLDPAGGTIAAGTLELATGSTAKTSGTLMANVLNSGGLVEPARSANILQITGDYTQTANGSLTTDIGGPGGGQFGRFAVTGTATLGGTLNITLQGGYSPANGVGFQVLSAGTLAGQFATINGLVQNGRRTFQITYRPTNFALVTVLDDLYPDLQVANLDTNPADGLHSGSRLTVNWNDTNAGKAATPTGANWYDRVLIKNLTTGQTLVNTIVLYDAQNRGPIAVNGSQAQQYTYTLPSGTAGAGQIEFDVTVNTFNDVFEFNDAGTADSNNTATITKTSVLFVASPDLRVANLATSFAGPRQSGASVTVTWDDANQGNAATSGSFYDTIVVSNAGQTIAQASVLYNEAATGNGPIAAGDHRSRQATLTLPDGPAGVGNLTFTVTTDVFNQIYETDHSHNTAGVNATVTLAPYPDLQVNNLRTNPANGIQSGTSLVIAWDDGNPGSGATPAGWSDALTIVNRTTGQTLLSTLVPVDPVADGSIPAGGTKARQYAFTLPDGPAGVGQIAITVTADASNSFFEYHAGGPNPNKQVTLTQTTTLAPYADLAVTDVQAPATALAGRAVSLTWKVANQGSGPAQGSWTDQVFVSPDQRTDDGLLVASFTYSGPIAAGQMVTRSETVTVPPTGLTGNYTFYVRTNGDQRLFELNRDNNTHLAGQVTVVQAALTLTPAAASVAKDAGTLTATIGRNGSLAAALTVNLASSNTAKLTVPATVTIPAGLASASFTVTVIQDGLADGNQSVTLTASATGLQGDMRTIQVIDVNKPTLAVTVASGQVREGDPSPATTGRVTRNTPTTQDLTVTLSTDDPVRLILPATVTIPAGQASATFPLDVRRDYVVQGPQNVTVQATATGFVNASVPLRVLDSDVPQLGVTLAAPSVLKNAPNPATFGAVSRDAAATRDLTVRLVSSDPTKITVPAQVVIFAGQTVATFPVNAVDNHLADGTQTITITAYVLTTNDNIQLSQGSAGAHIDLLDYHRPTLQVALAREIAGENSTVNATLSRDQATAQPLTVTLASDNTAEATVPATVTIPANQTSVMFPVTALRKAAQPATLTATAAGFNNGAARLLVTDQSLPDLKVTNVTIPTTALTQDQVTANFRVDNLGLAAAFGMWTDQVYLSPTGLAKDGTLLGTFPFTADPTTGLPVGLFYQKAVPFQLPNVPGDYWVLVTTNAGHTLTEGLDSNDTTVSAQPIHVTPAYTATVHSDVRMGLAGQPVTLRGTATKADSSAPAPYVPVTVRIQVRGTRRVLTALTDANGNYAVVFQPLPGEGGHYQIGAAHPAVPDDPVQDQFTLVGMTANPGQPSVTLMTGAMVNGSLSLNNQTEVPLTGIAATVLGAPTDLDVRVSVGTTLPGSGSLPFTYTVKSLDNSPFQGTLYFHVTSTEGATLNVPFQVTVNRPAPSLTADPANPVVGVLRGGQNVVAVTVTNQGSAASGDLDVVLPQLPWVQLASAAKVSSLNPGQSARIDLVLLPPADVALGNYSGTIVLRGTSASLSIPFTFRTLSDATGNLTITTVDEYTFYATGSPNLAGAHVTLIDSLSGNVVSQGDTDASGHLTIHQVREGYYVLNVQADKHQTYYQTVLVAAGSDNPVQAFLPRQTVQYSWTVVPTEVQDQTTIKIDSTFETNVPIPVVTIDPPLIDLSHMQPGETMEVDLTVTNHGLLAANEGQLHFGTDSRYRVTALITDIGVIPAMSSLTIPIIFQRLAGTGPQGQDGGSCGFSLTLTWTLICGNLKETYGVPVTIVVTPANCGGPGSIPHGEGGGGVVYFGGGTVAPSPCDPCGLKIAQAILNAAFNDLFGRVFGDAAAAAKDLYDLYNTSKDEFSKPNPDYAKIGIGMATTEVDLLQAGGRELPYVGEALELLDLANEIYHILQECKNEGGGGGGGDGAQDDGLPPDALALLTKETARLQTVLDGFSSFFGDIVWLRGTQSPNFPAWIAAFLSKVMDASGKAKPVSDADRALLLQMPLPGPVAAADVNKFLDRWNRTMTYWSMGITETGQVPQGQSRDFLALDDLLARSASGVSALQASGADGYPQILDGMGQAINLIYQGATQKNGGVCARVRLELDQQAVLTRDAFNATLQIANNQDTALTNVKIDVHVFDGQGRDVTSLFGVRPPQLTNLSAVDGTGQVLGGFTGRASWIILPSIDAAPSTPTQYFVSATLSYTDMGVPVVIPMDRTQITVYPQAQLTLKYFFQRDVFGPDPFSDLTLPSVPFSLGVIVSNTGRGTAKDVSITSAQPQIVDNQKGLLVHFNILGTEVNGRSLSPDLTADFGNIDPGQTAVGRWLMTSSLQGHFKDFQATFQHTDALGGQQFSLIQSVEIHELIHVVHMTQSGLPDFLVDDQPSSLHLPDTLYFGDGHIAPVTATGLGNVDAPASTSHLQVHLTATLAAGYAYLQIADPGAGNFHLVRVVRSDGTEIPVDDNVWETNRTFPDGGVVPVKENLLHLLDFNSTGSYTLYYAPNDPSPPQVASIDPVVPNPRGTPVSSIDVTFSKPIDAATFDYRALTLTRNGGPNLITNAVTVQYIGGAHYRINGLAGLTGAEGNYVLTVSAAGIKDPLGIAGTGSASVSWTTAIQAPTVASVSGVVAGPRNTPVTSITVQFTKPINALTVDYHVLTLTRDGGANLITSAVTVTALDFSTFRFDGLTGLTATDGHYVLVVDATKVKDATGITGVGAVTIAWDLSTANPAVVDVAAPSGTVNQTVDSIDVTFSKAIDPATFTTAALTLTRNGGANLITPAVTIQRLSPTQFRVGGLTGPTNVEGTYFFAVSAATVRDLAGNLGTGSASRTWVLATSAPPAATNIAVSPHFGMPPNDNITNTLTPTLSGQLGAANLSIALFDLTTNRDLGQATVSGTTFSQQVSFTTAGNHQVRVRVSNAGGNYTDTLYTLVIDVTPPAITGLNGVPAGSTTRSVASIDVVFSKPIQAATFDRTHLSLTRNGGANLITSAVTVTFVSGSTYRISGLTDLTRAKGSYALTINLAGVQDLYGNTASSSQTANWTNVLTASPLLVQMVEGAAFTGVVATLSDGDANTQAGDYTVQITWGDGTTTTGTVQATTPDNFNLLGGHTYAEEGSYPVTVTVRDQAGNTVTASSMAAVNDAALTATPVAVSARESAAFTGPVATFTDAGGNEPEGNYSATIAWGDDTTATDGTVRLSGNSFTVTGGHTYAEEGTYTVTVTIHEEGGSTTTITARATVSDADLHATAVDLASAENQALTNVVVATFTDDDPAGAAADYTATITWGDGSDATSGTVRLNSQTGRFEVVAGHTYADEGTYTVTVSLRDLGGATTTATSTARVSDPAVVATGGFSITAVEGGDSGLQTVATFTDPAGDEALADYTASIAWGDGSTASSGTISYDAASHTFTVKGSHTYAEEGSYAITVTIMHDAAPDASITGQATVADADLHAAAQDVQAVEGAAFQSVLASFTDDDPNAAADLFTATVDWGDGTAEQVTVEANDHGGFDVLGGHAYRSAGSYTITVDITDVGGSTAEVTGTAAVADADLHAAGRDVAAVEGQAFKSVVATFTDDDPNATADLFRARIDWGDGSTGHGLVRRKHGGFEVLGKHTYLSAGSYTITVDIRDKGGSTAEVTGLATVTDADLHATGQDLQASAGQAFTGLVATFTDDDPNATADLFTASIAWGDGTTDQVTVQANDQGGFDVLGSHTYDQEGVYTVTVDLADVGGSTAEVTGTATVDSGVGRPGRGRPSPRTIARTGPEAAVGLPAADWGWGTEAHRRRLTDALFGSGDWPG